jgi:hypothetical protein
LMTARNTALAVRVGYVQAELRDKYGVKGCMPYDAVNGVRCEAARQRGILVQERGGAMCSTGTAVGRSGYADVCAPHIRTCSHVCVGVCTLHRYMYVCICICRMSMCGCVCVCACVFVGVFVCVYAWAYTYMCMNVYMYTHIYTHTQMAAEALVAAVKKITGDALARFTVFRAGQNDCCFDETVALRGWEELLCVLLPRPWAGRARDTRGGGRTQV